jgi:raffinose/stachyose/melibiose transport system substrate-binding protein
MRLKAGNWIVRFLPFLVIGLAYAWAIGVVGVRVINRKEVDKKIIRIGHWQLEPGVREGFDAAAAEYEKLHPDVKIMQEAIPESGYGQWLSVQLLGGNAPDIVEMGSVHQNLLTMFYQRYVVPLTPYVGRANPYNKGTDLENVPLINTFLDGMRRSFIDETQDYMNIPLARMGIRLFYNKSLLKKLTGSEGVPQDFRGFLKVCDQIQTARMADGTAYTPISGSQYHLGGWSESLFGPATHGAFRTFDFNRDGRVGGDEWAVGYLSGALDFNHPSYRGAFALLQQFTRYFQQGWIGLTRDEAIFNFAQQKAVFISCGLWEAGSLQELADGKFELGVMDFPLPGPDDPEFGAIMEGPRYENPAGLVAFSVTKTSKHPELAIDFLLFLASRKQNELFNARLNWLPIIDGAKSSPELALFEPTLQGVFPAFFPAIGGESVVKWQQLFSLFLVNQIDYDAMTRQYGEFYGTKGKEDFQEFLRNKIRGQQRQLQVIAATRVQAMQSGLSEDWIRYRRVALRPIKDDLSVHLFEGMLSDPSSTRKRRLYEFSPEAMEHLRKLNAPIKHQP